MLDAAVRTVLGALEDELNSPLPLSVETLELQRFMPRAPLMALRSRLLKLRRPLPKMELLRPLKPSA
jgi:hypothetical protein